MTEELSKTRAQQAPQATHKFFLLFVFLLGYLILYPYTQNTLFGYYTFRVLAIVITALSVYAVSFRRSLVFFAMALAVPALVEHLRFQSDASALSILNVSLTLVFDIFIIVIIFRRVFVHGRPNSETIFGALCIYLLVGFSFGNLYRLLATLQSHAFYLDPASNLRTVPNRFDLIYYSFGTMTSLGTAGIAAVSDQARSLSVIEAILGVLYLAVLISKLMGAYRSGDTQE
jgi:hypothetical protein